MGKVFNWRLAALPFPGPLSDRNALVNVDEKMSSSKIESLLPISIAFLIKYGRALDGTRNVR